MGQHTLSVKWTVSVQDGDTSRIANCFTAVMLSAVRMSLMATIDVDSFLSFVDPRCHNCNVHIKRKGKKHLVQHLFTSQPHHRSNQVRHTLSKDHTVLPANHAFIHKWNEPQLLLLYQPKLVFIYRPQRDERLNWPRHHSGEWKSTQYRHMADTSAVSWSLSHLTGEASVHN